MRYLKRFYHAFATIIPGAGFYFSNFGGYRTQLHETLNAVTPVLASLAPFVVFLLALSVSFYYLRVGIPWLWKRHIQWKHRDRYTFKRLQGMIRDCRSTLAAGASPELFATDWPRRYARERAPVELTILIEQLDKLRILHPPLAEVTSRQVV